MGEVITLDGVENITFIFYHNGMIFESPTHSRIIQYRNIIEYGRIVDGVKYQLFIHLSDTPKQPWRVWHVDEKERDRIYDRIKAGVKSYMENKKGTI